MRQLDTVSSFHESVDNCSKWEARQSCFFFVCFPAGDGCRNLKSRVPDTISFSDRRLWRPSKLYPVPRFSDNEKNKKFLIPWGRHMADVICLRTAQER
jgi:hypothetical protein